MKFSISRAALAAGIANAAAAVSSKSSIPALEGILINAESALTLTGYDLENAIVCTLEAEIIETGSVVLSAQTFGEIVRKLPEDIVTVVADEYNKTEIRCGMSKFSIPGIPSQEYAELPVIEFEKSMTLPQNLLKSVIKQTVYSVSQNESKPVHTGCLFETDGNTLKVVGVDGYRLALRTEALKNNINLSFSFIVPGKTLGKLLRMLSDTDADVKINIAKKHAIFEIDNIVVMTRLLEGEFLNYKNAIPKENTITITAKTKDFIDSIERASLLISERQRSPVRLKFNGDDVKLLCISPLGRVEDEFSVASSGGEMEIGFNNKYLLDAFKNTDCDEVKIELKDSLAPMVIKPKEGNAFIFLVLPLRLKSEE